MQNNSPQASLQNVLDFREKRARVQAELRALYGATVISITINMPGSAKYSKDTVNLAYSATDLVRKRMLQAGFGLLEERIYHDCAGPAVCMAVEGDASSVKAVTVAIEEEERFGRILDLDVFDAAGKQISRSNLKLSGRPCMVCSEAAIVCMRERRHGQDEVTRAVQTLLQKYQAERTVIWPAEVELVGRTALEAMLLEAACAPAPGLVDRFNSGAHQDMDIFLFIRSSSALAPAMYQCALAAWRHNSSPCELLPVLREIGAKAEKAMFQSTDGVNTQKGLLFLMGIITAAAVLVYKQFTGEVSAEKILQMAAHICRGIVEKELSGLLEKLPDRPLTAGERFYVSSRVTGIRGEIEAGMPTVACAGLPNLRKALDRGLSLNDALIHTLLCLMTVSEDTTILKRHGLSMLKVVQQDAQAIVAIGGMHSDQGRRRVEELDQAYSKRGISPGGSADLLAVTYFIYAIENRLSPGCRQEG